MDHLPNTVSRIAPTPSGYLHMGNAFNFLLTWLTVKEKKGKLWLRIDDIDGSRCRPEYIEDIFRTLDWLGIRPDQGPSGPEDFQKNFSQQLRMPRYRKFMDALIEGGHAYACGCSRSRLKKLYREGKLYCRCREANSLSSKGAIAIRAKLGDPTGDLSLNDGSEYTRCVNLQNEMGDFVLWKKDGTAAYQLASVVDDEDMEINLIVRGKDLLASTAAQLWLAKKLDFPFFPAVQFIHHGLLVEENGEKLSKSEGAIALKSIRESGKGAEIVLREFAAWLGKPDENITTLEDLLLHLKGNIEWCTGNHRL